MVKAAGSMVEAGWWEAQEGGGHRGQARRCKCGRHGLKQVRQVRVGGGGGEAPAPSLGGQLAVAGCTTSKATVSV